MALYLSPGLQDADAAALRIAPLVGIEARIYNDLWNAIIDRKLPSGTKLDESQLCDIYGISRTVIRKVLVVMEQEGMVSLPVNRGAYIATPTSRDAVEIAELTTALVAYVAGRLAANRAKISVKQRALMDAHIAAEKAAGESGDYLTARRLRIEFFTLFAVLYDNNAIAAAFQRQASRLALAFAAYQAMPTPGGDHRFPATLMKHIYAGRAAEAQAFAEQYGQAAIKTLRFDDDGDDVDLKAILRG